MTSKIVAEMAFLVCYVYFILYYQLNKRICVCADGEMAIINWIAAKWKWKENSSEKNAHTEDTWKKKKEKKWKAIQIDTQY